MLVESGRSTATQITLFVNAIAIGFAIVFDAHCNTKSFAISSPKQENPGAECNLESAQSFRWGRSRCPQ
jgi:hypothetical protein